MEEFKEEPIKVYVKINENKEIVEVASSVFLRDTTGWIEIDKGYGGKFAHAQSQYFEKPLINEYGSYNYSFVNGRIIEK